MSATTAADERHARGRALASAGWYLDAGALAMFGVTWILSITDLWETPDTLCGQLFNRTGGFCDPISNRRELWVAWTVALTVVLLTLAVRAHLARTRLGLGRPPVPVLGLLALTVVACVVVAWLLAHGLTDPVDCGSTLSRVDPFGTYDPGRDVACAPSYAADRRHAWIVGGFAAALFVMAVVLGAASARRHRAAQAGLGRWHS